MRRAQRAWEELEWARDGCCSATAAQVVVVARTRHTCTCTSAFECAWWHGGTAVQRCGALGRAALRATVHALLVAPSTIGTEVCLAHCHATSARLCTCTYVRMNCGPQMTCACHWYVRAVSTCACLVERQPGQVCPARAVGDVAQTLVGEGRPRCMVGTSQQPRPRAGAADGRARRAARRLRQTHDGAQHACADPRACHGRRSWRAGQQTRAAGPCTPTHRAHDWPGSAGSAITAAAALACHAGMRICFDAQPRCANGVVRARDRHVHAAQTQAWTNVATRRAGHDPRVTTWPDTTLACLARAHVCVFVFVCVSTLPPRRHPACDQVPAGPGEYYEASAEDLAAFEYSADEHGPEWDRSTESWMALLASLGAPANRKVVRKVCWPASTLAPVLVLAVVHAPSAGPVGPGGAGRAGRAESRTCQRLAAWPGACA